MACSIFRLKKNCDSEETDSANSTTTIRAIETC